MAGIDLVGILSEIMSPAKACGLFESVNGHELKSAPGPGLICEVYLDRIQGIMSSGLDSTSARLAINVRSRVLMRAQPEDDIETHLMAATDALFTAYSGAFSLSGEARYIDLIGGVGEGLSCRFGYLEHDHKIYRVGTITVPVIVNDVWVQVA